jgi:5-methylcytosine-specific restriction endonuclease McrA
MHRGNEVDHIISRAEGKRRGLPDSVIESDDNLQTICTEAHQIKTAAEQGRTLKQKVTIGIDGWPINI